MRFEHTDVLADLDRAIDAGRRAVDRTPSDGRQIGGLLSGLGEALRYGSSAQASRPTWINQ
jgi:hypothetical protein